MQLTKTRWDFELFLLGLGVCYLGIALACEKFVFPRLARALGQLRQAMTKQPKQRKQYKVILESMRT